MAFMVVRLAFDKMMELITMMSILYNETKLEGFTNVQSFGLENGLFNGKMYQLNFVTAHYFPPLSVSSRLSPNLPAHTPE